MKSIFNSHAVTKVTASKFMKLQNNVLEALSPRERHFITPRSALTIQKHLMVGMPILGLFDVDDTMAGAVIVSHPDVTKKYASSNPMVAGLDLGAVAIIEGLYVDPRFQRHGLGTQLVFEAAQMAINDGRTHLSAEIAVENDASARTFAKNGFDVVAEFICPDDGAHVVSMQACAQASIKISPPAKLGAYTR